MSDTLILLAKAVLIAFIAACVACVPWFWVSGGDTASTIQLFPIGLIGTFAVGLPVALLTYYLSSEQLRQSASTVFKLANMAGVMLLLVTLLLGGPFGLIFGIPSFVAANVYAVLGWFWILKPQREALNV